MPAFSSLPGGKSEEWEGRGLWGLHTLPTSCVLTFPPSLAPGQPGPNAAVLSSSGELPWPELSCPRPPGLGTPMALMSAPSYGSVRGAFTSVLGACRPHFPAVNLPGHAGLRALPVIQRCTLNGLLLAASPNDIIHTHMDTYKICMYMCMHHIHASTCTYGLQK